MNIRFEPAFLPLLDAALLITQLYNAPLDDFYESSETYFSEFSKKYQIPHSKLAGYAQPLSALESDVMESISSFDSDRIDFFFRANHKESRSPSPAVAIAYYFSFPEQLADQEKARLHLTASCLPVDDFLAFETPEQLFSHLESSASPYSDRLRWRTFLLYHHFFDYAEELRSILEAATRAYERHRAFIDSSIADALARMKTKLGDQPAKMLLTHYHLTADFDELVVRPMVGVFYSMIFFLHFANTFFLGIYVDLLTELKEAHAIDYDAFVEPLKAIDDKNRFQILLALAKGPLCGQDLCAMLDLSPATVSHHMSLLISADFVAIEKIGTRIFYRYRPSTVLEFLEDLRTCLGGA